MQLRGREKYSPLLRRSSLSVHFAFTAAASIRPLSRFISVKRRTRVGAVKWCTAVAMK
jgi:hypothetical protein